MHASEDQWKRLQAAGLTTSMGHRIKGPLPSQGIHWFSGEQINNGKASPRWIYLWLPESIATEARANPPSLTLASKHLSIQHPSLDRWTFADADAKCLLAACVPIEGTRIDERLRAGIYTWQQSTELVKQIAAGLNQLHSSRLVHGSIALRSIWSKDDKTFILSRDPLLPPIHPGYQADAIASGSLLYTAPELSVPNQVPTIQSDLYSLGCVWLMLSTGKLSLPKEAIQDFTAWSRHIQRTSLESMIKGQVPSPLQKTISRLVAPNPDARFAHCDQLLASLSSLSAVSNLGSASSSSSSSVASQSSNPILQATQPVQSPKPAPTVSTPATLASHRHASTTKSTEAATHPTARARTVPASLGNLKRKKRKKKPVWLLPSMALGSILLFTPILVFLLNKDSSKQTSPAASLEPAREVVVSQPKVQPSTRPSASTNTPSNTDASASAANPIAEYYSVVADDGKSLWAPPSAGSPFSLEMLPAGLEGVVFLSSKAWKQKGEFASIGKWWSEAQPQLASFLEAIPFAKDERIESVTLAIYEGKENLRARWAMRYTLKQATTISSLTDNLPGFAVQYFDPKAASKQGIWTSDSVSSPLGIAFDELGTVGSSMTRRITAGPLDLIMNMGETSGGAAPVRRQMENLLKTTDSKSDITLLFAPSFVFGSTGQTLLADSSSILAWAREWIDESTSAIAISTACGDQWYGEVRMVSADMKDSGKTLSFMKERLKSVPDQLEAAMLSTSADPYWRALSNRFPQMLRSLQRYARFGLEEGQIVSNTYLPKEAGSNLAIATWMAITSSSADPGTKAMATAATPATKSMDDVLLSKISLSFEQESLESALQSIQLEVVESVLKGGKVSMSINGSAFQKDGITQNQQIRSFKQDQVPLRTVLTDLVRRANPVTTVQSATEKDQKVVWLLMDAPEEPTKKKIQLTTRSWAEANGINLPEEFVAKN